MRSSGTKFQYFTTQDERSCRVGSLCAPVRATMGEVREDLIKNYWTNCGYTPEDELGVTI